MLHSRMTIDWRNYSLPRTDVGVLLDWCEKENRHCNNGDDGDPHQRLRSTSHGGVRRSGEIYAYLPKRPGNIS
jgi:hypothetical protein